MHIFARGAIRELKGAGTFLALDNVDDKLLYKLRDTNVLSRACFLK